MARTAVGKKAREFDPNTFLATIGEGRMILTVLNKQRIFMQGDPGGCGLLRSEREGATHGSI
jgi:hypothetical protein